MSGKKTDKVINMKDPVAAPVEKEKKFSTTKLDKLIKDQAMDAVAHYSVNGQDTGIIVKYSLFPIDVIRFVNDVVDDVFFLDDNGRISYFASVRKASIDARFLQYFTNVKTDIGADRISALSYQSPIMCELQRLVSRKQWCDILDAINDAIEYRKREILSAEHEKLMAVTVQLDKAAEAFTKLTELFGSEIGTDQIKRVFDNLSNMDEEKFTRSVIGSIAPSAAEPAKDEHRE